MAIFFNNLVNIIACIAAVVSAVAAVITATTDVWDVLKPDDDKHYHPSPDYIDEPLFRRPESQKSINRR